MDSSNTIKEFFENQGGIKMELNTISGLAIAGVICSVVLSMGVPIALFIAGRVKLKARISSFFIGAGTYLLFAMLLEQLLHVLVIQFCGLNAQSRPWLYYVYAALDRKTDCHEVLDEEMAGFSKCTDVWNRAWRCGGHSARRTLRNQQSCVHADDQQRSHAEYAGGTSC